MMRRRHSFPLTALVALALASAWAFGYAARAELRATTTGAAATQVAAHPEVDPIDSCESCHADTHPEIVKGWESGEHALNGVKCFVCHGSVGDDFTRTPTTTGCIGCHASQVETMTTAFMKDKTCFTCHDPHALSPHRVAGGGR
jgi:hypothetical protein